MNPVDRIARLFEEEGARDYLGEAVTQASHMLQAAMAAQSAGAPDALVAAALLHDVGHYTGIVSGEDLMAGTDNKHSHTGADWLSQWFGPEVTEPVRLHVAAKRYLVATEPEYAARLSEASVFTLAVQGGPMSPEEAESFEREPYAQQAVMVRRWDDEAKNPDIEVRPFSDFRDLLESLASSA
jgi:gamma-butyrobetaine dioxygenase